jgi:hypothetical protein
MRFLPIHYPSINTHQKKQNVKQRGESLRDYEYAISTSRERSKHLCQNCGILFDHSFFSNNDLSDVSGFVTAIQSSGDYIDVDIGAGMTWLHYAAYGSLLEMMGQLLNTLQATIDARNDSRMVQLHQ